MQFQLSLTPTPLPESIDHRQRMLLLGSCFTEHIGDALRDWKFPVMQNPHGILFGPDAIATALNDYLTAKVYSADELFQLNECWHSWHHHSRFSDTDKQVALSRINDSIRETHEFLRQADWLILTLGSAFTYRLTDRADRGVLNSGDSVANCHRAPANWFTKELMTVDEILNRLQKVIGSLRSRNPRLKLMLTISPVRHIRDGLVENNRSKARLIQVVQAMTEQLSDCHYFPAYEYVIDVLRDHRFYDIDLVHPNYAATQFVLERFSEYAFHPHTRALNDEIRSLLTARRHRVQHPTTDAHRHFLQAHLQKTLALKDQHPELELSAELEYFSGMKGSE
jgi:lysophospholipase L1-like esterase